MFSEHNLFFGLFQMFADYPICSPIFSEHVQNSYLDTFGSHDQVHSKGNQYLAVIACNSHHTIYFECIHNVPSPKPIPVPPPVLGLGSVLVEIDDGVDDVAVQVITEDQMEGVVRRRVTIEEGGVFGVAGEFYKEGEDIMDVLRWVEAQDAEIPRYRPPPLYDDDDYVPDHQE